MEKKKTRKLPDEKRASIIMPIRLTPIEDLALKRMADATGEYYVSRVVQRLIRDAMKQQEDAMKAQVS